MRKCIFVVQLFISIGLFSQNWETVVLLPGRSPIKQIEIVDDNDIYVSSQYYKLHHWNGTEWKSVGDFNPNFNEKFQYVSNSEIYAIYNDHINSNSATDYNYIAKWNGTSWSNFGNFNQPKPIYNFKVLSSTEAYAVGEFDDLDDYRWRSVAKFNGTDWNVIGLGDPLAGTYSGNNSLWVNNKNDIYSKWDSYRSSGEKKVKHWDGTSWSTLRNFNLDEVYNVDRIHVVSENEIYINCWNKGIDYGVIGLWDGNYWRILGDIQTDIGTGNFYGSLDFLYVNSNEIYAFGSALRKRNVFTYQVAVWNGSKWNNLGDLNANNPVTAAFYKDGFLYVGGSFTESGKTLIRKINAQKILSTVSIDNQNQITAYPNPVHDIYKFAKEIKLITIFDIAGKEILQLKNQSQINVTHLKNGVYYIKLNDDNNSIHHLKMIKK